MQNRTTQVELLSALLKSIYKQVFDITHIEKTVQREALQKCLCL